MRWKRNLNKTVSMYVLVFVSALAVWTVGGVDDFVALDGKINVAGVFPIYPDAGKCGQTAGIDISSVMELQAVTWYLDKLNQANILPYNIGFRVYTTCGSTARAGIHAIDIMTKYRQGKYSNVSEDFIVGVIGPTFSSEAEVMSSMFSHGDQILQISYGSTSVSLSDRSRYKNFYRVIPNDKVQVRAMVALMVSLGWNRIDIIHENDTYGRDGAEQLRAHAQENHICIPEVKAIKLGNSREVFIDQINQILQDITVKSPKIEGVVIIATQEITKIFLNAMEELQSKISDIPIVLLSEGTQLQEDVVTNLAGTSLLQISKGSLAVSPPYTEVTSFSQYWNSLFTNTTALLEAGTSNPFLLDVFLAYTQCDLRVDTSSCKGATMDDINKKTPEQPTYVKYAILAAHVMAKAIVEAYKPSSGFHDFVDRFTPQLMLDTMDGLSISMKSDFPVQIEPLSTADFRMSFDKNPDAILDEEVEYEMFNFRKTNAANDFGFVKVGTLMGDTVAINRSTILDYTSDDNERVHPRQAICPVGQKCSECIRNDMTEVNLHIPGDVYIIGIASLYNRAIPGPLGCGSQRVRHGYQMFLTMKYALEHFKTAPAYHSVRSKFSDLSVGLILLNACNNDLEIVRKVLDLQRFGLLLEDGTRLDLTDRILGYVGGQSTDVSRPAADQLMKIGVVQISYSSTNPILSDTQLYPYFMRIVTPDNVQGDVMINIVKALGGEYIQVVYSKGGYGEGGRDAVLKAAAENNICVAQTIEVIEDDHFYKYLQQLQKEPHAQLVIVFLRSHHVSPFMRDLTEQRLAVGEFQFIGSEAWGRNGDMLGYEINHGSITVALEMERNTELDNYIRDSVPQRLQPDPFLEKYLQERQNCYFSWSYDKAFPKECTNQTLPPWQQSFTSDPWCIFVANTMFAMLKGTAEFYLDKCGPKAATDKKLCSSYVDKPAELVEMLKTVQMNNAGNGIAKIFDIKGDGTIGYKIYNIQQLPGTGVRSYEHIGSYSNLTGLSFSKRAVSYPTKQPIKSVCPTERACADCKSNGKEGSEATVTPSPQSEQTVPVAVFAALFGVAVLIIVAMVICFIRRQNQSEGDDYITATNVSRPQPMGMVDDSTASSGGSIGPTMHLPTGHRYASPVDVISALQQETFDEPSML